MSQVLDQLPEQLVCGLGEDIRQQGACSERGRSGLAAEQVLRAFILKQLTGMSFAQLAFALEDSQTYRAFCRMSAGQRTPKKSTLQENIKRIKPERLEAIHRSLVDQGLESGVETGKRVVADATAIESHIHHPTDSALLWDCVNRLTTLLKRSVKVVPLDFSNHRKRAKRRVLGIAMAKSMKARTPLYKDLLQVVGYCLNYANNAVVELRRLEKSMAAQRLADELEHFIGLTNRVIDQTFRRVFLGETVAASEKLVSIFEEHTDVIVKDNREPIYGHKAFLTVGSSGLVMDLQLPRGNPSDVTFAKPLVEALHSHHRIIPEEVAFDGGFCSHENLEAIQAHGVGAVAFTSPRGLSPEKMAGTKKRFQALRRFRASVEGTIGWLKNVFGFRRCALRSFPSFVASAWVSVIAHNALLLARAR